MGSLPDRPATGVRPDSVTDTGSAHRKVLRTVLGELVRKGEMSLNDALDELAAYRDLKPKEAELDPDAPYGPERPDAQFSKGRRGENSSATLGEQQSFGMQRASATAGAFIRRGLEPIFDASNCPTAPSGHGFLTYSADDRGIARPRYSSASKQKPLPFPSAKGIFKNADE